MWTRSELKEKAKVYVKRSYWPLVLVSLILAVITGGFSNGGNGGGNYSTDWSDSVDGGDIASRITGSITGINWALISGIMAVAAAVSIAVIAISVIVSIFVLNPIEIGCRRYFIEAAYGEVDMKNIGVLVLAFKDGKYGNIVKTMFLRDLYQFLWTLLLVIPGIVKSYEYRMIPYILAENPDVTTEEAFRLSKEMMDGEKWDTFVLDLSFIGWALVAGITCGIAGIFWVNPYMNMTGTALYETLKRRAAVDYYDKSLGGYENVYGNPGAYTDQAPQNYEDGEVRDL